MNKINLEIDTIKDVQSEELNNLQEYINQIIPLKNIVLIEKFQYIIDYNRYIIAKKSNIDLNVFIKKINKLDLEVSKTDISRIKKFVLQVNITHNLQDKFILESTGKFFVDKRLSLLDIHKYYINPINKGQMIKNSAIDFFSSIKIFDFYKNQDDKKNFFGRRDIQKAIGAITGNVKKIEILSIIDSSEIHEMLSYLYSNHSDVIQIKHLHDSENSYIPSLFFILITFKLKNSHNYKNYIFYLEEEVNFGVASYVSKTTFSNKFFKLLEERFDIQFNNPNNINFNIKNKENIFELSLKNIIKKANTILNSNSTEVLEDINDLKKQIVSLKLHYPKMKYSYELLSNITEYISIAKKISIETKNGNSLNNTSYLIKEIIEKKLNININNLLDNALLEQIYLDKKINILNLRKSIFVNTVSDTNKALCDIFDDLKWTDTKSILLSLKTIENNKGKLNELFSYFNKINESLSNEELHSLFKNRILNQIYSGEYISLNFNTL